MPSTPGWRAGQELARRVRPEAVHDVVDALGHADGVHHLAEQRRRGRRLLGRLDDHGVAGRRLLGRLDDHGVAARQRGADLPGHQQQRQVPRTDHADDAQGRAQRVAQRGAAVGRGHLEALGRHVLDDVGEDLEVGRTARDVDVRRQRQRLAGVGDLGLKEVVEAAVDLVDHRVQHLDTLDRAHAAPVALQRTSCGLHRRVDLGRAGLVHRTDQAARGRVAVVEGLAGSDEGAVDEIEELVHGVGPGKRKERAPATGCGGRPGARERQVVVTASTGRGGVSAQAEGPDAGRRAGFVLLG